MSERRCAGVSLYLVTFTTSYMLWIPRHSNTNWLSSTVYPSINTNSLLMPNLEAKIEPLDLNKRSKIQGSSCAVDTSGLYDIYSRAFTLTFNKNAIEGVTGAVFTNCSVAYLNLCILAVTLGRESQSQNTEIMTPALDFRPGPNAREIIPLQP